MKELLDECGSSRKVDDVPNYLAKKPLPTGDRDPSKHPERDTRGSNV